MNITPQYETKIIELPKGITIGDELHKQVIIREQTVGDIIDASHATTNDEKIFKQIVKRILTLGSIENPGETLLRNLNSSDFAVILKETMKMDGELLEEDTPAKKLKTPLEKPESLS